MDKKIQIKREETPAIKSYKLSLAEAKSKLEEIFEVIDIKLKDSYAVNTADLNSEKIPVGEFPVEDNNNINNNLLVGQNNNNVKPTATTLSSTWTSTPKYETSFPTYSSSSILRTTITRTIFSTTTPVPNNTPNHSNINTPSMNNASANTNTPMTPTSTIIDNTEIYTPTQTITHMTTATTIVDTPTVTPTSIYDEEEETRNAVDIFFNTKNSTTTTVRPEPSVNTNNNNNRPSSATNINPPGNENHLPPNNSQNSSNLINKIEPITNNSSLIANDKSQNNTLINTSTPGSNIYDSNDTSGSSVNAAVDSDISSNTYTEVSPNNDDILKTYGSSSNTKRTNPNMHSFVLIPILLLAVLGMILVGRRYIISKKKVDKKTIYPKMRKSRLFGTLQFWSGNKSYISNSSGSRGSRTNLTFLSNDLNLSNHDRESNVPEYSEWLEAGSNHLSANSLPPPPPALAEGRIGGLPGATIEINTVNNINTDESDLGTLNNPQVNRSQTTKNAWKLEGMRIGNSRDSQRKSQRQSLFNSFQVW